MTSLSRGVAAVSVVGAMVATFVGCAPRQPSREPKALEQITTSVPNLSNLPLKQAERILSFVALKIGKVALEETKDVSLHDKVFDQQPAPGTKVRGGTPVNVKVYYVARGKEASPGEAK